MSYEVATQAAIFITLFSVAYFAYILAKAVNRTIDLHDLIALSSLAIVPLVFVYFPNLVELALELVGVKFPFLVLFGVLFTILFVLIHRLISKINRITAQQRVLIQELALLKKEFDSHS